MKDPSRPQRRCGRTTAVLLTAFGLFGGLIAMPMISYGIPGTLNRIPTEGFHVVEQKPMEVVLQERGEIQSTRTKTLTSKCEYGVNLLWIADEGTYVKAGDIVAMLDSSLLEQRVKEREVLLVKAQSLLQTYETSLKVQELSNESQLAKTQLNLILTRLELAAYKLATANRERQDIRQKIVIAESNLNYAQKKYEYTSRMVELGYQDVSQRESDRLSLLRSKQALRNHQNLLHTLDRYSRDRKLIELIAKQEEAARAVERAKLRANASLLNGKIRIQSCKRSCNAHLYTLNRLKRNIAACTIRAQQDGQVIYARNGRRSVDTVKVGDLVRYLQPLLQLPDRSQLEVLVRLHESRIRQVEVGQLAKIQVDARSDIRLTGRVTRCATVPQAGLYPNQNLRDYDVVVSIDTDPETIELLAPGMTATAQIIVANRPEALVVPLESVVAIDGRRIAFVRAGDSVEVRDVETGLVNETQIEISSGLRAGEEIVSRPRDVCASRIESLRATYDEAGTGLASLWTVTR